MTPRPGSLRRVLGPAWARWISIAHVIGTFQARVLLSVFYFVVVPPFALIVKLFKDPLGLSAPRAATFWTERPAPDSAAETGRRQY